MPAKSEDDSHLWLEWEPQLDAKENLRLVDACLNHVEANQQLWKWIIIALHGALQSTCVSVLTATDGLGALDKQSEKKVRAIYYGSDPCNDKDHQRANEIRAKAKLATLPELIERLGWEVTFPKDGNWRNGRSPRERSLRLLHILRNQFVHLGQMHWSIELSGLPDLAVVTIQAIRDANTHPAKRYRAHASELEETLALLEKQACDLQKPPNPP